MLNCFTRVCFIEIKKDPRTYCEQVRGGEIYDLKKREPRLQPGGDILTQVWGGKATPYAVPAAEPVSMDARTHELTYLLSILPLTNNVNRSKSGLK